MYPIQERLDMLRITREEMPTPDGRIAHYFLLSNIFHITHPYNLIPPLTTTQYYSGFDFRPAKFLNIPNHEFFARHIIDTDQDALLTTYAVFNIIKHDWPKYTPDYLIYLLSLQGTPINPANKPEIQRYLEYNKLRTNITYLIGRTTKKNNIKTSTHDIVKGTIVNALFEVNGTPKRTPTDALRLTTLQALNDTIYSVLHNPVAQHDTTDELMVLLKQQIIDIMTRKQLLQPDSSLNPKIAHAKDIYDQTYARFQARFGHETLR
ncbi:MAG: hypothetical protein KBS86_03500 [Proteobacteria bacterium]|nr:hypothetical protein [Candidatus Enterousia scatequi]